MMSYKITYTQSFKKHYKKLSDIEKKQTKKKLSFFIDNPTHPSLRTKKIQGSNGLWESSVNMDIRIIWYYENNEMIILLDIGHHDILFDF
ncbi:type II toxin-antitoxin system YafQ family toxin [Finegoldia magna]|uniref:type II toxin-antitoxin system RelE/ParE family toxin n=1 Tax=Finegoldia magna TaxID=1260 RepID=UPI00399BA69C